MMTNKNYLAVFGRLASTLRNIHRAASIQSTDSVGAKMKQLNDAKQFKQALSQFDVHKQSQLTDLAINQALKACIQLRDFERGLLIHQRLSPRSVKCRHIQMSLVQLYSLVWHNRLEEALTLFEQMNIMPDEFILTIVFDICGNLANERALKIGRKIFAQLPDGYNKHTILMTSALNMFLKNGDVAKADQLFATIKSKDIVTYGAMMKGYNLNDDPLKTLALFERMKKEDAMIEYCRSIAAQIPDRFLTDLILQNALIDMWGKAGLVDEAQRIFETIQNPDTVSFSAMINGFGLNGFGSRAVDLYKRMPAAMHNEITHICVLNACSHSGLVNDALSIFKDISSKTAKITTSMVDCLSRLQMFDEVQKLVADFEQVHVPYPVMYMAMMSVARTQFNTNLSEKLFVKMKTLFPDLKDYSTRATILLANTYSWTSEQTRSSEIRKQIQESPIGTEVGRSWTCVNGNLVEFRAHDTSHPRSAQIYEGIVRLSKEIVEHGHKYDSRWITRPLGSDETVESVLSGHSERLAIAFNFIQKSIPTFIQITKNLRICGDCHAAIKLIAKIRQRGIALCRNLIDYRIKILLF